MRVLNGRAMLGLSPPARLASDSAPLVLEPTTLEFREFCELLRYRTPISGPLGPPRKADLKVRTTPFEWQVAKLLVPSALVEASGSISA